MKKLLIVALGLGITLTGMSQGGGFQRRTPEERVASIHAKLDSAFKLAPAKFATLDTALLVLFKAQDAKMQEMFSASERPDRETMRAEMEKFSTARDEMIKAVLTEAEFIIWRDKIEPSMRPQRRGGGPGGNRP